MTGNGPSSSFGARISLQTAPDTESGTPQPHGRALIRQSERGDAPELLASYLLEGEAGARAVTVLIRVSNGMFVGPIKVGHKSLS